MGVFARIHHQTVYFRACSYHILDSLGQLGTSGVYLPNPPTLSGCGPTPQGITTLFSIKRALVASSAVLVLGAGAFAAAVSTSADHSPVSPRPAAGHTWDSPPVASGPAAKSAPAVDAASLTVTPDGHTWDVVTVSDTTTTSTGTVSPLGHTWD